MNDYSIHYLGENLLEVFPDWCEYFRQEDATAHILPRFICNKCSESRCDRNADYIEAILSDNVDYKLDDIIVAFVRGLIDEREAIEEINKRMRMAHSSIKIQVLLRKPVIDYVTFFDYKELPLVEDNREKINYEEIKS